MADLSDLEDYDYGASADMFVETEFENTNDINQLNGCVDIVPESEGLLEGIFDVQRVYSHFKLNFLYFFLQNLRNLSQKSSLISRVNLKRI